MQQNVNTPVGTESGDESFAALFEASLKERGGEGILKEGDIVKGTVVQLTKDYAVVDIGYKSEGQIPISEFTSPRGEVTVKEGDAVEEGQIITIIEAMKMENEITAHKAGTIEKLPIKEGEPISAGALIAVIKSAPAAEAA